MLVLASRQTDSDRALEAFAAIENVPEIPENIAQICLFITAKRLRDFSLMKTLLEDERFPCTQLTVDRILSGTFVGQGSNRSVLYRGHSFLSLGDGYSTIFFSCTSESLLGFRSFDDILTLARLSELPLRVRCRLESAPSLVFEDETGDQFRPSDTSDYRIVDVVTAGKFDEALYLYRLRKRLAPGAPSSPKDLFLLLHNVIMAERVTEPPLELINAILADLPAIELPRDFAKYDGKTLMAVVSMFVCSKTLSESPLFEKLVSKVIQGIGCLLRSKQRSLFELCLERSCPFDRVNPNLNLQEQDHFVKRLTPLVDLLDRSTDSFLCRVLSIVPRCLPLFRGRIDGFEAFLDRTVRDSRLFVWTLCQRLEKKWVVHVETAQYPASLEACPEFLEELFSEKDEADSADALVMLVSALLPRMDAFSKRELLQSSTVSFPLFELLIQLPEIRSTLTAPDVKFLLLRAPLTEDLDGPSKVFQRLVGLISSNEIPFDLYDYDKEPALMLTLFDRTLSDFSFVCLDNVPFVERLGGFPSSLLQNLRLLSETKLSPPERIWAQCMLRFALEGNQKLNKRRRMEKGEEEGEAEEGEDVAISLPTLGRFLLDLRHPDGTASDDFREDREKRLDSNVRVLYHQTDRPSAERIVQTQTFRLGTSGIAGCAIYFASSPEGTYFKARQVGAILRAEVRLGVSKMLPFEGDSRCTFGSLLREGYDSVCIRRGEVEWAVYNPDQIKAVSLDRLL